MPRIDDTEVYALYDTAYNLVCKARSIKMYLGARPFPSVNGSFLPFIAAGPSPAAVPHPTLLLRFFPVSSQCILYRSSLRLFVDLLKRRSPRPVKLLTYNLRSSHPNTPQQSGSSLASEEPRARSPETQQVVAMP